MDSLLVKQRLEQFDAKHGESAYDGRWIYYADGANRDRSPYGPLNEPSADKLERHRCIVRYYEIRLDDAVKKFDETKKHMLENPGSHPDAKANVRKLRTLQRMAKYMGKLYAEAVEARRRDLPGYKTPEQEAYYQEQAQAQAAERAAYEAAINSIHI